MKRQVDIYEKPRLSIIVPVLNGKKYIDNTLKSLEELEKSVECEVIFQNSCSTDGTAEILDKFCDHGKRRYHFNEKDSGQSDAINIGIEKSSGEWVTWLCADDIILPAVSIALDEADRIGASICYGDVIFINNGNVFPAIGTERHTDGALAKRRLIIQQPGTCVLRKVWRELEGVKKHLNWTMDYDFFLRMESMGKVFHRSENFIAIIRVHRDAKTSSGSIKRLFEIWSIVGQSHGRCPKYFRVRPYLIYGVEYIIKYLEAAGGAALKRHSRLLLRLLHTIFWVIANPREKREITERFNTMGRDTTDFIHKFVLSGGK